MSAAAPVITIDGPSGTGKGTAARRLQRWLGWHLLDSGALYRLVGFAASQQAIALDHAADLATLAAGLPVSFRDGPDETRVILNDQDVTDAIRSEESGAAASRVAAHGAVRDALLARQRAFCQPPGLVADGRDMGTVVFPAAALKVFLTASADERAQRRYKQLKEKGMSVNLAQLLGDIQARDKRDEERTVAPLRPATDAVIIDTTRLDVAAVEQKIRQLVATRGLAPVDR